MSVKKDKRIVVLACAWLKSNEGKSSCKCRLNKRATYSSNIVGKPQNLKEYSTSNTIKKAHSLRRL